MYAVLTVFKIKGRVIPFHFKSAKDELSRYFILFFVLVYMNTVNPVYLQMVVDLLIFADHSNHFLS